MTGYILQQSTDAWWMIHQSSELLVSKGIWKLRLGVDVYWDVISYMQAKTQVLTPSCKPECRRTKNLKSHIKIFDLHYTQWETLARKKYTFKGAELEYKSNQYDQHDKAGTAIDLDEGKFEPAHWMHIQCLGKSANLTNRSVDARTSASGYLAKYGNGSRNLMYRKSLRTVHRELVARI